jgi:hypothetical protein
MHHKGSISNHRGVAFCAQFEKALQIHGAVEFGDIASVEDDAELLI